MFHKAIMIGDISTGKTTLNSSMFTGQFNQHIPTVGTEVRPIHRGEKCVDIWDISGNPKYRCLFDGYCIGAEYILACFNSEKSLINLRSWISDAFKITGPLPVILIRCYGSNPTQVKKETIKSFTDDFNCKYFKTCAKKLDGVKELASYLLSL